MLPKDSPDEDETLRLIDQIEALGQGQVPDLWAIDYPMTAGHREIQALRHAVDEVWIAISHLYQTLNHIHYDNPTRFTDNYEATLRYNLDFVYQNIARIPARMIALVLERKIRLDALKKDQLAVQEKLAAVVARERELVADAEAFEKTKEMANNKMMEAIKLLRAVEKREKLIERRAANREVEQVPEGLLDMQAKAEVGNEAEAATAAAEEESGSSRSSSMMFFLSLKSKIDGDRDREPMDSTEKPPVEEFNLGADAAAEDAADAADAVTRIHGHLTIRSKAHTATMERDLLHSDPEMISHTPSDVEFMQSWRDSTAAREERLWDREVIVSSREKQLSARESICIAREKILAKERVDWEEEKMALTEFIVGLIDEEHDVEGPETKLRNFIAKVKNGIRQDGEDECVDGGS